MTKRRLASTAAAAGVALLTFAAPRAGATTVRIGQVAPAGSTGSCIGCTSFQEATDPGSPTYTVPGGSWMVTSWGIMSGVASDGHARLRIFRPEGSVFRLVAESNEETVIATPGGAERSFTSNIPVQGGDLLGIGTGAVPGDLAYDYSSGVIGDVVWNALGTTTLGQTVGPGGDHGQTNDVASRINIAATLFRPDPAVPDTTPPDTTITSGPGKKLSKGKAKFTFTSSEAGSTFVCKLDRKAFQPCTSPKKYKHLRPGKHKLQIEAVDSSANVDATPAVKKFKVPK